MTKKKEENKDNNKTNVCSVRIGDLTTPITSYTSTSDNLLHTATKYISESYEKQSDVTQKLLKELIQEIKDLKEEGDLQAKEIEAMRKEMDEFKDEVAKKVGEIQAFELLKYYPGNSWTSSIGGGSGGGTKGTWTSFSSKDDEWTSSETLDDDESMKYDPDKHHHISLYTDTA